MCSCYLIKSNYISVRRHFDDNIIQSKEQADIPLTTPTR